MMTESLVFHQILSDFRENDKLDKIFKNGPSEICGTEPLKKFTWSILEYFVPDIQRGATDSNQR